MATIHHCQKVKPFHKHNHSVSRFGVTNLDLLKGHERLSFILYYSCDFHIFFWTDYRI